MPQRSRTEVRTWARSSITAVAQISSRRRAFRAMMNSAAVGDRLHTTERDTPPMLCSHRNQGSQKLKRNGPLRS